MKGVCIILENEDEFFAPSGLVRRLPYKAQSFSYRTESQRVLALLPPSNSPPSASTSPADIGSGLRPCKLGERWRRKTGKARRERRQSTRPASSSIGRAGEQGETDTSPTALLSMATAHSIPANRSDPLSECDHLPYDQLGYTIRVPLMLPILIFGLLANTMNVFVFRHKRMRSSMVNWYLVSLSITDVGVLLSSFCMLSLPVVCEDVHSLTLFNLGVSAQRWTYALGLTMQTASVGMTVLVSSHRFLGVVYPFRAQRWCTAKRVKVAIWSVGTFSVLFNIPRWFELTIDACQSSLYNATATSVKESNLRLDQLYYSGYMVILYTLVMFAMPFLLLILMNTLIVRTVHKSYRLRQMLTHKISTNTLGTSNSAPSPRHKLSIKSPSLLVPIDRHQQCQTIVVDSGVTSGAGPTSSSPKENKTTIMLIAVVFMFLFCNSLAFINNILEVLILANDGLPLMDAYLTSVEISNFLVVINSASNIFIYWTFSARYRLLCRRYVYYFCCCFSSLAALFATGFRRRRPRRSRSPNGQRACPNRLPLLRGNYQNKNGYIDNGRLDKPVAGVVRLRQQRRADEHEVVDNRYRTNGQQKLPEGVFQIGQIKKRTAHEEPPLLDKANNNHGEPCRNRASVVSSV